jgi:hypothetical protein
MNKSCRANCVSDHVTITSRKSGRSGRIVISFTKLKRRITNFANSICDLPAGQYGAKKLPQGRHGAVIAIVLPAGVDPFNQNGVPPLRNKRQVTERPILGLVIASSLLISLVGCMVYYHKT